MTNELTNETKNLGMKAKETEKGRIRIDLKLSEELT
jgi:hypothetical protein